MKETKKEGRKERKRKRATKQEVFKNSFFLSVAGSFGVDVSILVVCRVNLPVLKTRMSGVMFYVGTSSTSPYLMGCVGVIFSNEALTTVCRLGYLGIPMGHL